jgi:hypothetical protein
MSLLLGLPYAINDTHCYLESKGDTEGSILASQNFVIRCGIVAGQVIDLTQATTKPSFSSSVRIDEELENIAASMPSTWWDIPHSLADTHLDATEIRQRLLTQVFFFHVKTYVYLPFMLRQESTSRCEHSRKACMHTAREMIRRYHLLRSDIHGQDLFECKTNDFVGFMASAILLIGIISDCSKDESSQDVQRDCHLIETSMAIFQRLSTDTGCNIALQCHRALDLLIGMSQLRSCGPITIPRPEKIFIPYFGSVSVSAGIKATEPRLTSSSFGSNNINTGMTSVRETSVDVPQLVQEEVALPVGLGLDMTGLAGNSPSITYNGIYQADSQFDAVHWGGEMEHTTGMNTDAGSGEDLFSCLTFAPVMDIDIDIDQDWSLFLESAKSAWP